jgi:hypothetical protein
MTPIEELFIGALVKKIAEVVQPLPPYLGGQAALLVAAAAASRSGLTDKAFVEAATNAFSLIHDFVDGVSDEECSTHYTGTDN